MSAVCKGVGERMNVVTMSCSWSEDETGSSINLKHEVGCAACAAKRYQGAEAEVYYTVTFRANICS